MKFLHLSDFHLGKVIAGQDISLSIKRALDKSIEIMKEEKITVCVVSGDIFNEPTSEIGKSVFAYYLNELIQNRIYGLFIFGNHDKLENISFLNLDDLKKKNIYIATSVDYVLNPIKIEDTCFYLLPYCGKKEIQKLCPELKNDCKANDCFAYLFNQKLNISNDKKNVLVCHRTVKDIDTDNTFKKFNYVALGHVHDTKNVNQYVRYAGSIIKFDIKKLTSERKFTIVDTNGPIIAERKYTI